MMYIVLDDDFVYREKEALSRVFITCIRVVFRLAVM